MGVSNFQSLPDVGLKQALVKESLQRDAQIPFGKFQYVDVIFLAANTDQGITHLLAPQNPNRVRFLVVDQQDNTTIYRSSSVTAQPWTSRVIYLRCTTAGIVARLLLFLEA